MITYTNIHNIQKRSGKVINTQAVYDLSAMYHNHLQLLQKKRLGLVCYGSFCSRFSATRCLRLMVRTSPFHGENRSSILLGTTKYFINPKTIHPCH